MPFRRVSTSVQRCRRWSVAEKVRPVEEAVHAGRERFLCGASARHFSVTTLPGSAACSKGDQTAVQADEYIVGASQVRELEKRVRDFERMLGNKTMEAEILREALNLARPEKTRPRPVLSWSNPDDGAR